MSIPSSDMEVAGAFKRMTVSKFVRIFKNIFTSLNLRNLWFKWLKIGKQQKIYIHIGMPKTGSSAIQALLALNPRYLHKFGFAYPNHTGFKQAFQTSAGNVAEMAKWIEKGQVHKLGQLLRRTAANHVILSSEILFVALKKHPQKFAQFFAGTDYKIICYIREKGDLLESILNQQIKNHCWVNYADISKLVEKFNYYECLLKATEFIEPERITVRKYGQQYFYKGSIYADFMHVLGLKIDPSLNYPEKVVNPSLNRDCLELRVLLNKGKFAVKNIDLKYRLNGLLAQYSVQKYNLGHYRNEYPLLTATQRVAINKNNAEIESRFKQQFFQGDAASLFELSERKSMLYVGLCNETIADILSFIKTNDPDLFKIIVTFIKDELSNQQDQEKFQQALQLIQ
jgi:hypothetical protein